MMISTQSPRGLFLNPPKSNCSIYESGAMIFAALRRSPRFRIEYLEIDEGRSAIPDGYDFYAFNYHHIRMRWLECSTVRQLPGLRITFVLEVVPNDPFVLCPGDDFDAYCPLDPTIHLDDRRVYAFPRPLERYSAPLGTAPVTTGSEIPVIGSFGFSTPGKGFELVVDAVGREFERAVVRINIPKGDFLVNFWDLQYKDYAKYLTDLCRSIAKPGIDVQITQDYMTKDELISWCQANTLNCFLYYRDQPGLAATTDQAVSSGQPLAVSANETFRHIHEYLPPYPRMSLRNAIRDSATAVQQMQRDWAPENFARRFERVLEDAGLLERTGSESKRAMKVVSHMVPVLLINHKAARCGIHQYGANICEAACKMARYKIIHAPCESQEELTAAVESAKPKAIIYNYYPCTMPWLTPAVTRQINIPQLGIMHEVTQDWADNPPDDLFDFHICPDPMLEERKSNVFRLGRLIPPYINPYPRPNVPTIGSFGFGFADKGFERLVCAVQESFEEATIRLHIPVNDIVDAAGDVALETARRCQALLTKSGIKLEISHNFLMPRKLLDFLAQNSINAFFYDELKHRGISSVLDYALAVQRPIAVSQSAMFRHILSTKPSICIEHAGLAEILNRGIAPLVAFYNEWSEPRFLMRLEAILDKVLSDGVSDRPFGSPHSTATHKAECAKFVRGGTIAIDMYIPLETGRATPDLVRSDAMFSDALANEAKRFIGKGSVVLDIGADFGQRALWFSQLVGAHGLVFAFEADAANFSLLQRNIGANGRSNINAFSGSLLEPVETHNSDEVLRNGYGVFRIDQMPIPGPINFVSIGAGTMPLRVLERARKTIMRDRMAIAIELAARGQEIPRADLEKCDAFVESVAYEVSRWLDPNTVLLLPKECAATLHGHKSRGVYNRILDNAARERYASTITRLFALVPEMMARKIPEANVQQGFVMEKVIHFSRNFENPRILCVGSFEDTAAAGLKALGYVITEIDPVINYDLNTFCSLPTTRRSSFEIVFSTSVLEHVENDELFVRQVSDLLAPGGVAVLTMDYNDDYVPGAPLPKEDFRFYTERDICERLLSKLADCDLVDEPDWDCPNPDFTYAGCRYTFATLVFRKRLPPVEDTEAPTRIELPRKEPELAGQKSAVSPTPSFARRAVRFAGRQLNTVLELFGLRLVRYRRNDRKRKQM